MAEVEEDGPVEVTLVLHGGRVGEELGNMALLEVGSAIAAVTSPPRGEETRVREIYAPTGATDGPRFDPIPPHPRAHEPEWMHDDVPRAFPGASHPTTVIPGVKFPSMAACKAAVRRCALIRMALRPRCASGAPADVASAFGAEASARCAAQVLAPGRKHISRAQLERVGAELWDAGVGRAVAVDRAWLEALSARRDADAPANDAPPPPRTILAPPAGTAAGGGPDAAAREEGNEEDEKANDAPPPPPPRSPPSPPEKTPEDDFDASVFLHPEGSLCAIACWGADARNALRHVEAPNAMPPEQAFLAVNAARVRPGDVVLDPCVGGGAVLLAALKLGARRAIGCDVDAYALDAATRALREVDVDVAGMATLRRASLLDASWHDDVVPRDDDEPAAAETETAGDDESGAAPATAAEGKTPSASARKTKAEEKYDAHQRFLEEHRGDVDAIVTDLPYGVRSAAVGVGEGAEHSATPKEMLIGLLVLARKTLRPVSGVVAVWLQRWDGDGGMSVEDVTACVEEHGFEVFRVAAEDRKNGVCRALYVLKRREGEAGKKEKENEDEDAASDAESDSGSDVSADADPETADILKRVAVIDECVDFNEAREVELRRAIVLHARLRRNENYRRVAEDGGLDPWRAAWVGDMADLERHVKLIGASALVNVKEPCGAKNTPLLAAAGNGRTTALAAMLDLSAQGVSARPQPPTRADGTSLPVHGGAMAITKMTRGAIIKSAEHGHLDAAVLLMRRGANPADPRDEGGAEVGGGGGGGGGGGTALHSAAERGHTAVVEALCFCERYWSPGQGRPRWWGAGWLREALAAKDADGRTPLEAATRWGHANVVRTLIKADPDGVSAEKAAALLTLATRWGHAETFHAIIETAGHGRIPALQPGVEEEARRWSRAKLVDVIADWRRKVYPESVPPPPPPAVDGARVVHWDPATGAAVLYVPSFWDPDAGYKALREEVERGGGYVSRDDPLVMPADRRGERKPVPRDQAYYGACYLGAADENEKRQHVSRDDSSSSSANGDAMPSRTLWWSSYRYNPDHTRQPPPRPPPAIIRGVAAKVKAISGQTCNHAVVNRYVGPWDSIGPHSDKVLDLDPDSYVVSVSFGAARVMTFEPKRVARDLGGGGGATRFADDVKKARMKLRAELNKNPTWRDVSAAKAAAAPFSRAKALAIARERELGATLRASDASVANAAAHAREVRNKWLEAKAASGFRVALEPGSAIFFNMAFNAEWTHAIHPTNTAPGAPAPPKEFRGEDEDEASDEDEDDILDVVDDLKDAAAGDEPVMDFSNAAGERIGVTLRRSVTVFDPVRQTEAIAGDKSRAWRKRIWKPLSEMADVEESEKPWREKNGCSPIKLKPSKAPGGAWEVVFEDEVLRAAEYYATTNVDVDVHADEHAGVKSEN